MPRPRSREAWLRRAQETGSHWSMGSSALPFATLDLEAHLEQARETYLAGIDACREALRGRADL